MLFILIKYFLFSNSGFQHIVLRRLAQITLQISEISKKLDTINGTRMKDDEGDILIQFDDKDALYEFDRKLGADKRVFKKFVSYSFKYTVD